MPDVEDPPPTEASPLVTPARNGGANPSPVSTAASSVGGASADEMERPWPATLDRSLSLLASPLLAGRADYVDAIPRSPRFGAAPLRPRRRQASVGGPDVEAGSGAPEGPSLGPRRLSGWDSFKVGQTKNLSFTSTLASLRAEAPPGSEAAIEDARINQERKATDAKLYRAKILATQEKKKRPRARGHEPTELDDALRSPGYHREKAVDRRRDSEKREEAAAAKKAKASVRDATFSQCSFNLANILMGVGLLGLPYVFRSAGWFGGFFVTLLFSMITWWTTVLIGRELNGDHRPGHFFNDNPYKSPVVPGSSALARTRVPMSTFPDIAREAFGDLGCTVLSSVLYFELFSCLSIFFVSLGDHLHALIPEVTESHHMCIVAVLLTIPTALLRTPRLLSYLSTVGTFATLAVVLSVCASAITAGDITDMLAERLAKVEEQPHHILWNTSGLPLALGLIAYAFSGHAIVPSIYSSMKRPQDFEKMATATFAVVICCCLLVASSGYYMFGEFVDDQVTLSLAMAGTSNQLAMNGLTWLMVLTAFSKFTLTMFPLALGLEEIVAPYVPTAAVMEATSALIKLILIALALAVAIFFPSFSLLCSLVGLICTMIVSVIFPAGAHLRLFGNQLKFWDKALDWLFIGFGLFMAIAGTIATMGEQPA